MPGDWAPLMLGESMTEDDILAYEDWEDGEESGYDDGLSGDGDGGAPWLALGWDGSDDGDDGLLWSLDRKNLDKHASLYSAMRTAVKLVTLQDGPPPPKLPPAVTKPLPPVTPPLTPSAGPKPKPPLHAPPPPLPPRPPSPPPPPPPPPPPAYRNFR